MLTIDFDAHQREIHDGMVVPFNAASISANAGDLVLCNGGSDTTYVSWAGASVTFAGHLDITDPDNPIVVGNPYLAIGGSGLDMTDDEFCDIEMLGYVNWVQDAYTKKWKIVFIDGTTNIHGGDVEDAAIGRRQLHCHTHDKHHHHGMTYLILDGTTASAATASAPWTGTFAWTSGSIVCDTATILAIIAQSRTAASPANVLAYYKMDETTGVVLVDSGPHGWNMGFPGGGGPTGHTPAAGASTTYSRWWNVDFGAIVHNLAGFPTAMPQFSVEGFLWPLEQGVYKILGAEQWNTGNVWWEFGVNANTNQLYLKRFETITNSLVTYNYNLPHATPGVWQHYAVTSDETTGKIKFYIQGQLVSTQTIANPLVTVVSGDPGLYIDPNHDSSGLAKYGGLTDDTALFGRILTDSEILGVSNQQTFRPYPDAVFIDNPAGYLRMGDYSARNGPALGAGGTQKDQTLRTGFHADLWAGGGGPAPTAGTFSSTNDDDGSWQCFGTNSSIDLDTANPSVLTAPFTVEALVNASSANATMTIVGSKKSGQNQQFQLYMDIGAIGIKITDATQTVLASAETVKLYNDSAWHHIAVSVGTASYVVYIDGAVALSGALGGTAVGWNITNGQVACVGAKGQQTGTGENAQPFTGYLDEVAWYQTALTGTQVVNHYNAISAPIRAGGGTPITITTEGGSATINIVGQMTVNANDLIIYDTSASTFANIPWSPTGFYYGGSKITDDPNVPVIVICRISPFPDAADGDLWCEGWQTNAFRIRRSLLKGVAAGGGGGGVTSASGLTWGPDVVGASVIADHTVTGEELGASVVSASNLAFVEPYTWHAGTPTTGSSTYKQNVLADSPLGYYRLNEASGATAADSSGNARNATYQNTGAITYSQTAALGDNDKCIKVTASNNNVSVPSAANIVGGGARTIECLVKTTQTGDWEIFGCAPDGGRTAWYCDIEGTGTRAFFYVGGGTNPTITFSGKDLHDGAWHHVVITYDGATTVELWIDGVSQGTGTLAGTLNTNSGTPVALQFLTTGITGTAFTGNIDEIATYGAKLSNARIAAHYAAIGSSGITPSTPDYWTWVADSISGSAIVDHTITTEELASGLYAISGASDAVITSPSASQVLMYDGTHWINSADPGGTGGGGGGTIVNGPAPGLVKIGEVALTSPGASLDFQNIPSGYEHLQIVLQGAGSQSAYDDLNIRFNNDSGANYTGEYWQAVIGSTGSGLQTALTAGYGGTLTGTGAAAGSAGLSYIDIPNYGGSTFWKQVKALSAFIQSGTAVDEYRYSQWQNTAPITRITLSMATGGNNFVAGTVASLYALAGGAGSPVAPQTYKQQVLADGPLMYFRLDDITSTAADSSGNALNGTLNGGYTQSVAGVTTDSDNATLFNGSTGYISNTHTLAYNPFTFSFECWFKTSTAQGLLMGIAHVSSGAAAHLLYIGTDGELKFDVYQGSHQAISSAGTVTDGAWHHAVAVLDGLSWRLYLDGAVASASSYAVAPFVYAGAPQLFVGGGGGTITLSGVPSAPASSYLNGTMDEVALYATSLSAQRALIHYQAK